MKVYLLILFVSYFILTAIEEHYGTGVVLNIIHVFSLVFMLVFMGKFYGNILHRRDE